ncbi:MAG: DUF1844 domain-containing protein [Planctomycetes bacterium]|nr:DUF1844 domain-containing protein [Planctomycetota bacterium]
MAEEDDDAPETRRASDMPLPGGDFRMFILKLNFQALIALGVVENPVTQRRERNLPHARMVIDDLRMLREKTKGNLSPEEEAHLSKALSDLQFQFVRVAESPDSEETES